jgi:hypothetical protein
MNEERTGKCLRQVEHIRGHRLILSLKAFLEVINTLLKGMTWLTVMEYLCHK